MNRCERQCGRCARTGDPDYCRREHENMGPSAEYAAWWTSDNLLLLGNA